jgi:hypothetical protein
MALDYLTQGNWKRDDAKTIGADGLSGSLSEAERALQELADVFLQQQLLGSRKALDLGGTAESKLNPEAPLSNMEAKYRALGANSRGCVHGLSGQGNRRSLRQSTD